MDRGQDDVHPYFNDGNPYWLDFQEAVDNFSADYDLSNLPLFYVDLCEYVVRAIRLWWYILRYRKRGKGMIESGVALSSPELIKLSQKITGHGMVALRIQDEYEDKVLS